MRTWYIWSRFKLWKFTWLISYDIWKLLLLAFNSLQQETKHDNLYELEVKSRHWYCHFNANQETVQVVQVSSDKGPVADIWRNVSVVCSGRRWQMTETASKRASMLPNAVRRSGIAVPDRRGSRMVQQGMIPCPLFPFLSPPLFPPIPPSPPLLFPPF